jgi:23S rRNA pseudouridine2605 synthase
VSVRLNKLLAQRGVGARRKCDALIQQGAVQVNGRIVREPGTQVDPARDRVTVNDRPLAGPTAHRYFVLNKPVGVITTLEDPEGRRTIREFLPPGPRLFPVGRLDADTSGLLVLTNDGELAHHLMHPRYGVTKVYRVRLDDVPTPAAIRRLEEGVEFEPGVRSAPARVRLLSDEPGDALLQIALHEGRYRQVRRMCEAVGLHVRALHRSAYGPVRLGPVPRGMWRELSDDEVRRLRADSARPRGRAPAGYRSPRAGGDAKHRLARRLARLAGAEPVPSPGTEEGRRGGAADQFPPRGGEGTTTARRSGPGAQPPWRRRTGRAGGRDRAGRPERELGRHERADRAGTPGGGTGRSEGSGRAGGPGRSAGRPDGRTRYARPARGSDRPDARERGRRLARGSRRAEARGRAGGPVRSTDRPDRPTRYARPARGSGRPDARERSRRPARGSRRAEPSERARRPGRGTGPPEVRGRAGRPARESGDRGRRGGTAPSRRAGQIPRRLGRASASPGRPRRSAGPGGR